jgi:hypothetical protein
MPNMYFDNIAGSHKAIKSSSSMLATKVGSKEVLNEVDNDFLHLSSWISLETLIAKAPPFFCRATMAKAIATPYNKLTTSF